MSPHEQLYATDAEYTVLVDDVNGRFHDVTGAVTSVEYDVEPVDLAQHPTCTINVDNHGGRFTGVFETGRTVKVKRNGRLEFRGIVEPREHDKDVGSDPTLTVRARHEAWKKLQGMVCDKYDFDEDGSGLADAVVNPWQWSILRNPNASLDSVGQFPAVDGFRPDECMEQVIGTKLLHANHMQSNKFFLRSMVNGDDDNLSVYRNEAKSQQRAHLQLTLSGDDSYASSGTVESIPLYNGDPNLDEMGNVQSVTCRVWGVRDSGDNDPSISVCRDATASSRTYTSMTQDSFTSGAEAGLDKWEFSAGLTSDGASAKNEFAYKVSLSGGGSDTTTILGALFIVTTESDTGVTAGSIDTYTDNTGSTHTGNDLVELNVAGKRRVEALSDLRGVTVSNRDDNPSPHWDVRLTPALELHLSEREGRDLNTTYSFGNDTGKLRQLGHEFEGDQVYYQVMALGAGSGDARNRIISAADYDDGGLYFPDVDPDDGAKYGDAADIGVYDDSNIEDATTLLRRARAFAKLHSEPIETITARFEPDYDSSFSTFDSIKIDDEDTDVNSEQVRVVGLRRLFSNDSGEDWEVQLGEPELNLADTIAGLQSQVVATNITRQPRVVKETKASAPVHFTGSDSGTFTFTLDEPVDGERVLLTVKPVKWQTRNSTGISVFRGDDDSGDPVYATLVETWVDPDNLDSDDDPQSSSRGKLPIVFGKSSASTSIQQYDITPFLGRDSNDIINEGEHEVKFMSNESSSPNTNGLGAVQVTVEREANDDM